jgi:hypothetical protein
MLDDLLFTLKITREELPTDAHSVHTVRLFLIERIIRPALEQEPEYWRNALANAEQIAGEMELRRMHGDTGND